MVHKAQNIYFGPFLKKFANFWSRSLIKVQLNTLGKNPSEVTLGTSFAWCHKAFMLGYPAHQWCSHLSPPSTEKPRFPSQLLSHRREVLWHYGNILSQ